jgi:pimeloyl-ACP methyl ester carboxylesterase
MPAVFVHGVPETHIIWDPIRSHLSRKDVIAVDMPGFGAPLLAGFDSTKEAYAAWLIAEIEKIGEPVDLVGHDWGSLLTCASPPRGPTSSAPGPVAPAPSIPTTSGTTWRACGKRLKLASR